MMENSLRQISVVFVMLVTIMTNILADTLPINALGTAATSDSFHVCFVTEGYIFAIWEIIYINLIAYTVHKALPFQKENPPLQATGCWVVLGGLVNRAWFFL